MSSAAAAAATPAAAGSAAPAGSKAILLQALQQRLATLQKTVGQQKQTQAAAPTPPPSSAAPTRPSASPPSALEMAKAMLAAKIAAKEAAAAARGSPSPSPSPLPISAANATAAPPASSVPVTSAPAATSRPSALSVQAVPFFPASAAAASAAGLSTAAAAAPGAGLVAPRGPIALHKTQLCRSWLTCSFGAKCRFRHPQVDMQPFFDYGGDVLLHLNAANPAPIGDSSAYASPSSMPPVLLLILTLILQSGPSAEGGPSLLPLMQLWSSLREQLSGCKELPANQDDMLNVMGLPTTAAVVQRAAEGQSVLSTDAFRNMYACVFSIRRDGTTFVVTHHWDEERRDKLQAAIDAVQHSKQRSQSNRSAPPPSSTNQAYAVSHAAAAASDEENRKRKRVPDSELGLGDFGSAAKQRRLGEAYPEEQDLAARPAFRPAQPAPPTAAGHYSMDAGEEMGGATAFVRGGIVTQLSLAGQSGNATRAQMQSLPSFDSFESSDPLIRAIRRQQQVQTHATYTVHTKRITSGKGFDMLQRMNWRHGQGLGKRKQGRVEPVEVKFRADRAGL